MLSSVRAGKIADKTTKAPRNITMSAVKLTRKASAPYLESPEFSRKVSFSKNPNSAVATANTYTKSPNRTCHGRASARTDGAAPG